MKLLLLAPLGLFTLAWALTRETTNGAGSPPVEAFGFASAIPEASFASPAASCRVALRLGDSLESLLQADDSLAGATTPAEIAPTASAARLPIGMTGVRAPTALVLDGLYLAGEGDAVAFERWFAAARVDDLLAFERRSQRALAAEPERLFAAGIDRETWAVLQRENVWLNARLSAIPIDESELDRVWIPIGVDDAAIDAHHASFATDALAVELWHAIRAERFELARRSDERFALGFYIASAPSAEG